MVVSRPKRALMDAGSVWKEGRVEKVVSAALTSAVPPNHQAQCALT